MFTRDSRSANSCSHPDSECLRWPDQEDILSCWETPAYHERKWKILQSNPCCYTPTPLYPLKFLDLPDLLKIHWAGHFLCYHPTQSSNKTQGRHIAKSRKLCTLKIEYPPPKLILGRESIATTLETDERVKEDENASKPIQTLRQEGVRYVAQILKKQERFPGGSLRFFVKLSYRKIKLSGIFPEAKNNRHNKDRGDDRQERNYPSAAVLL